MTDSEQSVPDLDLTDAAEPADVAPVGCRVTTVDIVNMRAGPGLEYSSLRRDPL